MFRSWRRLGVFISACDTVRPTAGKIWRAESTLRTLALSLGDSHLMAAAAQQLFSHRIVAVGDGAADLKLAIACDRTKCLVRRFLEWPS
jgi:hypothetical protein